MKIYLAARYTRRLELCGARDVLTALGHEVQALETYSVGSTCIFPYYDFFTMRTLVAAGQMSWRRWVVEVARALQPVGCLDDPKPALVATARILGKAIRNRLASRDA
jgi:hypothetical protein